MQNQRASAAEVSDAVGRSLQNFGQVAGNTAAYFSEVHKQKVDADAIANTGPQLAEANGFWANRLTTLAQSSRDGGIVQDKDGQSIGMTNQMQNEFQEWRTGFLSKIDNEKARQYAQQHIDSLWSSVYEKSLATEAKLGVENRADKADQTTGLLAKQAATDPTSADKLITDAKTQIANSGLDEHTRVVKAIAAEKTIVESALMSKVESDPAAVISTIEAHLNATTEMPPTDAGPVDVQEIWNNTVAQTLKFEGEKFVANDAGHGPSKHGILWSTYFHVKKGKDGKTPEPTQEQINTIKNLTKEQAIAFYKKDFWDSIGGDDLAKKDPGYALAAFDTAVNLGVDGAKPLLKQANGDLSKLLKLRQGHYDRLTSTNPERYGKYADNWKNRVAALREASTAATNAATSKSRPETAPMQPVDATVAGLVSKLEPDRIDAFLSQARTAQNRQQAVYRSQITTTENDHVAAYMNGQPVEKALSEGEYVKAYGPIEGSQRYANYVSIAQMGNDIASMKLMPPAEIDAMVAKSDPTPQAGQPGYDLALKRYDALLKARDAVVTARSSDPVAYAMQNKIADAAPLPFNDPAKLNAALATRAGVAQTMQDKYQTPYTLLTKAEATTLNQGFQKMTTQQKLAYLNTFKTSLPNDKAYMSILQQIAPDSPVTAVAGNILVKTGKVTIDRWGADDVYTPESVSSLMLEGEALINPTKAAQGQDGNGKLFPMPSDDDIRRTFNNTVGTAFANNPKQADVAFQAVKAYYAGKAARNGDVSGIADSKIVSEAVNAVVGGISDVNGNGDVVRPWGMPADKFTDSLQVQFNQKIAAAGYTDEQVASFRHYGVVHAGGDKYVVRAGTGYLLDKQGQPIVLDLSQPMNAAGAAPAQVIATVTQDKSNKPNTTRPKTK